MKYIFCLLFSIGCSNNYSILYIHDEFKPFYNEFEEKMIQHGKSLDKDIKIEFVDKLSGYIIGLCEIEDEIGIIRILKGYWNISSNWSKKQLLFHEFGHCILNRHHKNEIDSKGNPISIMVEEMFDSSIFKRYYVHYENELFTYSN